MHRYGSVRRSRYNLPQGLGADIAYGEDTGNIGAAGFIRHHIALGIQRNLALQQIPRAMCWRMNPAIT